MMAAACVLTAVPAQAANLTETSPTGDTSVTGQVVDTDKGDVTYIVSIPDKVDFGTLQKPENSEEPHNMIQTMTIEAEEIAGLDSGDRVAVLVKDATDTGESENFKIVGQDVSNKGKELIYEISNKLSSDVPIQSGTRFPNGYLVSAFAQTGDSTELTLTLDQNQLVDKYLPEWVGNYKGTLNFYSTVTDLNSVN